VREKAERLAAEGDSREAFRVVFTRSRDLTELDTATFARLAAAGSRADTHAQTLIAAVVGPATTRLRDVGGLRPGITVDDIARFVRMTLTAGDPDTQVKAIDVLLAGLVV
jgi:hypothetical protein